MCSGIKCLPALQSAADASSRAAVAASAAAAAVAVTKAAAARAATKAAVATRAAAGSRRAAAASALKSVSPQHASSKSGAAKGNGVPPGKAKSDASSENRSAVSAADLQGLDVIEDQLLSGESHGDHPQCNTLSSIGTECVWHDFFLARLAVFSTVVKGGITGLYAQK